MKTCSECHVEMELSMFSKDRTRPDGHAYICRRCRSFSSQKYYKKNLEQRLIRSNAYNAKHKAEKSQYDIAYHRQWKDKNPDRIKLSKNRYRARQVSATIEPVPVDYWKRMIDFYGARCMVPDCPRLDITLDHIVALANEGSHSIDNFQILCSPHNSSKGNHHSTDYRPYPRMGS